ncbi:S8 family serine peptidase [Solwaraspora sp. WMMD406]|uniref:S8 family serine peptidase n=1 Tax=Solwaraspora sp. WMMD406 TaxID=3016095 RepID=UPI002417BB5B|nr:S8 family serine peptidase [Solwaraspora sp. WMMD406]MDG4765071.1 S8 family serine peptidase [Solwaraspora sp. WMMD406]
MLYRFLPACVALLLSALVVTVPGTAAHGASGFPTRYGVPSGAEALAPLVVGTLQSDTGLPRRQTVSGRQCVSGSRIVATSLPWAQRRFAPTRVWPLSTGDGVLVAVVDSGVSRQSTALTGAVASGARVAGAGAPDVDCDGHGTFVAGVIAARPQPGSAFVGLAPAARILPVRVTDDEGTVTVARLAAGIRAAVDAGAKIVTVSLVLSESSRSLHDAVRYATARGALVVAAADIESDDDVIGYPAAYPEVLAVGAVHSDGVRAGYSAAGGNLGVVAPGADVTSVGVSGPGHLVGGGSGVAAGFVSATAALTLAYRPGLSPAQLARRIKTTADRPGREVPDSEYGYGVVDPYAAVSTLLPQEWSGPATNPVSPPAPPYVSLPVPADPRPAVIAYLVTGGAVAVAALTALATAVRRRHRAQQARRPDDPADRSPPGEAPDRAIGQPVAPSRR